MPDQIAGPDRATQPLLQPASAQYGGISDTDATPKPPWPTHDQHHIHHDGVSTTKGKTLRIAAAMFSFSAMGLLLSTIGLMLPALEAHYRLDDAQVSLIFTVAPVGYILATCLTGTIHARLGRRGIALVGPALQLLATVGAGLHPGRYEVFVACLGVGSVGIGLLDGAWCSWAGGSMGGAANTVSGLLHGSFSAGAGLGPLLGGLVMVQGGLEWFVWYYILAGVTVIEGVVLAIAFRNDTAQKYLEERAYLVTELSNGAEDESTSLLNGPSDTDDAGPAIIAYENGIEQDSRGPAKPTAHHSFSSSSARAILTHPVVWICAAFLLVEVGVESSVSGWVVLFLRRARNAPVQLAAAGSSAFWIGQAVGRLSLGPATDRYGLQRAVTVYLVGVVVFGIAFALLGLGQQGGEDGEEQQRSSSSAKLSVALVALMGVFCGPLFPSAIVQLTSALPRELHVGAVTYVAMIGQIGGALLPVCIGLLIQRLGIETFPSVVVVQIVLALGFWLLFPVAVKGEARRDERESLRA
ncbi:major facilitator superfamily domain-containing protein [Microdochium trichocladiopsis]|uniref:Major facilitator superfamily domain-containing protein n=1 Tax=Microdochium trichocladiopsis TaxID=1682393 RepID=A0A9P8XXF5_9PEZI|nr:major facilitator superfamily domain-containing protein [Microdochium trichocladiopsis]KAH7024587.1 major facilitator superfamily domain-containing protein [Microdochium trichocladiopsis]